MQPAHKTKLAGDVPPSNRNMRRRRIVARFVDPFAARPRVMEMLPYHKTKLGWALPPSK